MRYHKCDVELPSGASSARASSASSCSARRTSRRRSAPTHANCVTYSLADGKTETWIADRTGHRSSLMINRYRRRARNVVEAGLGSLAPWNAAIPDVAPASRQWDAAADTKEVDEGRGLKIPEASLIGPVAQSAELWTFNP